MTLRDFAGLAPRHTACAMSLACAALAACSSPASPPPDTFLSVTLNPHKDANNRADALCAYGSPRSVLSIGNPVSPTPTTVATGTATSTGDVTVFCSVTGGFQVGLTGALGGTTGGTLQISGHVGTSGGTGITASFASGMYGNYDESDCTIAFTYNNNAVPMSVGAPIAPGRIFGHLLCPSAPSSSGHVRMLPDGSTVTEVCDLEADFEFENCLQ